MVTATLVFWANLWARVSPRARERAHRASGVATATATARRHMARQDDAEQGRWVAFVLPGSASGTFPVGGVVAPLD